MSNAWVGAAQATVLRTGAKSRPCEKAVLLYLADVADEDGFSWPRVSTISRVTELSGSKVRAALKWLEEEEYLERQPTFEPAGRQTSNTYLLTNLSNPPNKQHPPTRGVGAPSSESRGEVPPRRGSTGTSRRNPQSRKEGGAEGHRRISATSEFEADAEESPGFGKSNRPARPPRSERDELAAKRGTSVGGQVFRLRETLKEQGYTKDPVNLGQLTKTITRWGLPVDTVRAMVDVFLSNPQRYLKGDEVPWTCFIRQRETIEADAKKRIGWSDGPGDNPYANERIV